MPKIISEVKEKILSCTKKKLFESGYSSISLRGIAKECNIAVGTIYNYFANKDTLIANVLLEDWIMTLTQMDQIISTVEQIDDGFISIYFEIKSFYDKYQSLFNQAETSNTLVTSRHGLLVNQIQERIRKLMLKFNLTDSLDLACLLAECTLISSIRETISAEAYIKLIHRIF